jgi:ribosomal protein S18 acetylase RimI-like enzyme
MTVAERRATMERDDEFVVSQLRNRDEIRTLLETRRPYTAYALGQLDPVLFRLTDWWIARGSGRDALMLHSRGGLGNATFALGESGALEALLMTHPGPRQTFLTCEVHHVETVARYFDLEHRQTMIRMLVTPDEFVETGEEIAVRRLTGADARAINSLYRADGVPSYYSPRQIDESVYFGAEREGRLVAIAGTHVISPASGIAVVGNVYTHPNYRGRHLAQATTRAVTSRLLRTCRDVVLSVDPTNSPAVRAYERLGYREVARLVEGAAVRRDASGVASSIRRIAARLRGRGVGSELVRVPSRQA